MIIKMKKTQAKRKRLGGLALLTSCFCEWQAHASDLALLDSYWHYERYNDNSPDADTTVPYWIDTDPHNPLDTTGFQSGYSVVGGGWDEPYGEGDLPSFDEEGYVWLMSSFSDEDTAYGRPILSYSSIKDYCSTPREAEDGTFEDGILEVEYGEYPQNAAPKDLQDKLNAAFSSNSHFLQQTGRKYDDKYDEYAFNGSRYIKYEVLSRTKWVDEKCEVTLSNGQTYKKGEIVWIEVKPIIWWIDESEDIAMSANVLLGEYSYEYYSHSENKTVDVYGDIINTFLLEIEQHMKDKTPNSPQEITYTYPEKELAQMAQLISNVYNISIEEAIKYAMALHHSFSPKKPLEQNQTSLIEQMVKIVVNLYGVNKEEAIHRVSSLLQILSDKTHSISQKEIEHSQGTK